ncbi:hypothetical protein OG196_01420 [Kitasatospora purpeofusca]|uniref:hypothetical protein n=1 Tax=Kitasatospora purpeofusca TaxID=67352 RepID=UPI002E15D247|nr:hypothetical protein OG196_01420 [Kitasatospora purpeofusca]
MPPARATGDWKFRSSPAAVYNPDTRTAEVFGQGADGIMARLYNTNGGGWSVVGQIPTAG